MFSKLKEIEKEIEVLDFKRRKEEQEIIERVLLKKDIKLGDRIFTATKHYGRVDGILNECIVRKDYFTNEFEIIVSAKQVKKDGNASKKNWSLCTVKLEDIKKDKNV